MSSGAAPVTSSPFRGTAAGSVSSQRPRSRTFGAPSRVPPSSRSSRRSDARTASGKSGSSRIDLLPRLLGGDRLAPRGGASRHARGRGPRARRRDELDQRGGGVLRDAPAGRVGG